MKKTNATNFFYYTLFLSLFILNSITCDLLVRSPNELKSQFISMSIY